ncbi:MAG: hypothetical protein GYB65_19905 [Chloroflexi bacterium]|nr:hypothetical protein [Chloroflexota bacterium]
MRLLLKSITVDGVGADQYTFKTYPLGGTVGIDAFSVLLFVLDLMSGLEDVTQQAVSGQRQSLHGLPREVPDDPCHPRLMRHIGPWNFTHYLWQPEEGTNSPITYTAVS